MRGAGSGALILGSVISGQVVDRYGLTAIVWLNAALLGAAALFAPAMPRLPRAEPSRCEWLLPALSRSPRLQSGASDLAPKATFGITAQVTGELIELRVVSADPAERFNA